MYPLGFMLGGCSPCCEQPCSACAEGSLPSTLTVAFSGIPETALGPPLISLSFSSCRGSGAAGYATSPVGKAGVDDGPISAISLTSGGSGYAVLGREAPALSVSSVDGEGSGGTFAVTLDESKVCNAPQWGVGSITITGGSGYAEGDRVYVGAAEGDTVEQEAVCYIRTLRLQPTLTASASSGSGATFSIAYQRSASSPFTWAVQSVAVVNPGSGYADGDSLSFALGVDDVEVAPAVATISTPFSQPTLTASVAGGSGAQFSLAYAPKTSPHEGWYGVSSVAVTNGGTGYSDNASVTFTLGTDDVLRPGYVGAIANVRTVLRAPNDSWTLAVFDSGFESPSPGSGLQLSIALTQFTYAGRPAWKAASATVTNGGSGYSVGDFIEATANEGVSHQLALFQVTAVSGGGAVASVSPDAGWPGRYVVDTGVIESVHVSNTGVYRKGAGTIASVTVANGGEYYKESTAGLAVAVDSPGVYYRVNPSLGPYVADVSVTVTQNAPSDGSGVELSAVIDDDPESETFGQITAVAIDSGGDDYLAHETFENCLARFNGRSIVVRRNYPYWRSPYYTFFPMSFVPEPCTYGHTCANINDPCSLEAEAVRVEYLGPNEPMRVMLFLHYREDRQLIGYYYPKAYGFFAATENVQNCSGIDMTAYGSNEPPQGWHSSFTANATAHIQAGGEYEEQDTCRRIASEDLESLYVDVNWRGISLNDPVSVARCGYNASIGMGPDTSEDVTGAWCDDWKGTVLDRINEAGTQGTNVPSLTSWSAQCSQVDSYSPRYSAGVQRDGACQWKWAADSVVVRTQRDARIDYNRSGSVSFIIAQRICEWTYPIINVPMDADLIPSGQVEFGEPTYITLAGSNNGTAIEPFWFDNLFTEQEACGDPGPPTVTFSRLP